MLKNTSKAIELETESLEITKELYKENPQRWAEKYTRSLNSLAISYYKDNQIGKSLELFNINYEIHKKHYGENDKRTLEVLANIKIVNGNSLDKREATLTDLLYLSKFIAQFKEEKEININSFINALAFIEFNEQGKSIFSQITNLDELKKLDDAQQYIEQVKNTPKIPYSDNMKSLAEKLKEIFGNNSIGKLR